MKVMQKSNCGCRVFAACLSDSHVFLFRSTVFILYSYYIYLFWPGDPAVKSSNRFIWSHPDQLMDRSGRAEFPLTVSDEFQRDAFQFHTDRKQTDKQFNDKNNQILNVFKRRFAWSLKPVWTRFFSKKQPNQMNLSSDMFYFTAFKCDERVRIHRETNWSVSVSEPWDVQTSENCDLTNELQSRLSSDFNLFLSFLSKIKTLWIVYDELWFVFSLCESVLSHVNNQKNKIQIQSIFFPFAGLDFYPKKLWNFGASLEKINDLFCA